MIDLRYRSYRSKLTTDIYEKEETAIFVIKIPLIIDCIAFIDFYLWYYTTFRNNTVCIFAPDPPHNRTTSVHLSEAFKWPICFWINPNLKGKLRNNVKVVGVAFTVQS